MIEMDIIDVEARKLRSEGDADENYGIAHTLSYRGWNVWLAWSHDLIDLPLK
jgi:hypothetical protein